MIWKSKWKWVILSHFGILWIFDSLWHFEIGLWKTSHGHPGTWLLAKPASTKVVGLECRRSIWCSRWSTTTLMCPPEQRVEQLIQLASKSDHQQIRSFFGPKAFLFSMPDSDKRSKPKMFVPAFCSSLRREFSRIALEGSDKNWTDRRQN